ncbi:MAG: beta-ketoacyl-[acyl-carrier-protein] synthase family protein [Steroidobacteraceae bacterium]
MTPLLLTHYTATSGLGRGCTATLAALETGRGALRACHFDTAELDTQIAEVEGLGELRLPDALKGYDCRNNRLALLALAQDRFDARVRARAAHWGPHRVGVFIGTTTSGIHHTEIAYRRRDPHTGSLPPQFDYRRTHNSFSVTDFVRRQLGLTGPAATVCTACSSSAKVFAAAQRMLVAGLIDAAVVGGVDSLCLTTLYGFHSLQLTSSGPCRPFDAARDGLSIGEAAAFALLERAPDSAAADEILLLGTGESSDAHHMSSPHPDGLGAAAAMRGALTAAHASPGDIDYINLHGTGTPSNDSAESRAVAAVFGVATPCSSTKGATGHTLGAAGALEAVISALALRAGLMPGGVNTRCVDPTLPLNYLTAPRRARIARVLSNSFGFGGANCALLLARAG